MISPWSRSSGPRRCGCARRRRRGRPSAAATLSLPSRKPSYSALKIELNPGIRNDCRGELLEAGVGVVARRVPDLDGVLVEAGRRDDPGDHGPVGRLLVRRRAHRRRHRERGQQEARRAPGSAGPGSSTGRARSWQLPHRPRRTRSRRRSPRGSAARPGRRAPARRRSARGSRRLATRLVSRAGAPWARSAASSTPRGRRSTAATRATAPAARTSADQRRAEREPQRERRAEVLVPVGRRLDRLLVEDEADRRPAARRGSTTARRRSARPAVVAAAAEVAGRPVGVLEVEQRALHAEPGQDRRSRRPRRSGSRSAPTLMPRRRAASAASAWARAHGGRSAAPARPSGRRRDRRRRW